MSMVKNLRSLANVASTKIVFSSVLRLLIVQGDLKAGRARGNGVGHRSTNDHFPEAFVFGSFW
jgi:hypothetical protein